MVTLIEQALAMVAETATERERAAVRAAAKGRPRRCPECGGSVELAALLVTSRGAEAEARCLRCLTPLRC